VAFRAARNAALTAGGTALTSYIDSMSPSRSWDLVETTTFGNVGKTRIATLQDFTLSLSGHWDPTTSTGPDALMNAIYNAGTAITWVAYPGGTASGQVSYTFSGLLESYSTSSDVGSDVTWSASISASGTATIASI
jgi:hypothetical protein